MARTNRRPRFNPAYFTQLQNAPAIYSKPIRPFGLKGHDATTAISRLGEGYARLVQNLMFRDGKYVTRDGTETLGDVSAEAIVHALEFALASGGLYKIRFRLTGVDVLLGSVWTNTGGTPWSTTDLRYFSVTGWGDRLVFAEDTLGIYELEFTSYSKKLLTFLPGVKHLATFGGRILASMDDGSIHWCVKNDETDWAGVGSGYEDFNSAPAGQTAVLPISDDTALCLRTDSVWIMRTTGDPDVPFSFTRYTPGKGCKWPRTAVQVSGGGIWLGEDGTIWMYHPDQYGRGVIDDIAQPIYKRLQVGSALLRRATAAYEARFEEYRLTIPDGTNTATVNRFNSVATAWTEDTYQFGIRSMASVLYGRATTIDELVGTIDSLVGAIDDLTTNQPDSRLMFTAASPYNYVILEKPDWFDAAYVGGIAVKTFQLITQYVRASDPLHRTETEQLLTEYECTQPFNLDYAYSDDGGVTWVPLASTPIVATTKPVQHTWDLPLDRENIQFKVSSAGVLNFQWIDFIVFGREGGLISDAN